ncbi:Hef [Campylobacter phage vB_CcoM-IBB_35]|uniref:Hef n=1 Tax=Campylobacter virus IBB35 TaxID=1006972 RepID=H6SU53_9CAUD|nr:homing endonuclease [Campylobacter phage vB_CcoM-IBB_35]AEF56745.1 Hef [Campylobacter phage vB_CcoM-IBB_35]
MKVTYKNITIDLNKTFKEILIELKQYPLYRKQIIDILLKDPKFNEEFYSIYEDYKDLQNNPNFCVICGTKTKTQYCKECLKSPEYDKIRIAKIKSTKLERYGDANYNNIDKHKETIKEKYNVENISQIPEVNDKIRNTKANTDYTEINNKRKETNLNKYNAEYATQSEVVKNKTIETNLKKYGVISNSQTKEFKEAVSKTWASKSARELAELSEKRKQTNLEIYGNECGASHITKWVDLNKEFIEENFINDSLFDKEAFMYYFNISDVTAAKYKKKFNISAPDKSCRSQAQNNIAKKIEVDNMVINSRSIIRPYELDIFLPDYNLAIEYDGLFFHSRGLHKHRMFNTPDYDKKYHLKKTEMCESLGIQLFHIFESDDLDIWFSMINNKLGLNKKIYARKCIIKELNYNEVSDFLNENHLQKSTVSKINLGLFYNDKLVEVMTFGKPRFNKNYEYELIRLCTLKHYSVIGGASKLFKYFLDNYKPKSIVSYANRRFSKGSIYKTLGFKFVENTEPNYFYFKDLKLLARHQFQKHKLKEKLEIFDPSLSESANMMLNGYRIIHDCGNMKFQWIQGS